MLRALALACALTASGLTYLADGRIPLLDDALLDVATLLRALVLARGDGEDDDVALVLIDERSLDSERLRGRPRTLFAPEFGQLVDALLGAGAKAVAFDVIFQFSGGLLSPGHDRPFLQALHRHRGRVVLGRGRERREVPSPPFLGALGLAPGSLGLTELRPDRDGVVREIHLKPPTTDGGVALTLAGAALTLAGVSELPDSIRLGRARHLELLPAYSLVDVLGCASSASGRAQLIPVFDGRLVFIGTSLRTEDRVRSATRLLPRPTTPRGEGAPGCALEPAIASASDARTVPGVFLHAAAAQAVLSDDTLSSLPPAASAALAAAGAFLGFALARVLRPIWGLVSLAALGALLVGLSTLALELGVWLAPLPAALSALGAATAAYLALYVLEGRRREQIQRAFGRYLAPSVVEQLADEGELGLGGDLRDVTIMFADLSGFTAMSTRVPAEELVQITNQYLALIATAVDETNGYVDKFIGDAVMAMWGAPLRDSEHALHALDAALRIAERVADKSARAGEGERFGVKIGLESGEAIVGNVGSEHRYNYTAVGKTVNIASRLEGLPGAYGCSIVIGPALHGRVSDRAFCRELDMVVVKGNDRALSIYEPLAYQGSESARQRALAEAYAAALAAYRARRFDEAASRWHDLEADDGPSRTMSEAARRCAADPPPPGWDGSRRLTSR